MDAERPPARSLRMSDVYGEAVLITGGGRAVLLQLANPAVGRGVARHSAIGADPTRRFWNTLTYVYAITYGTPEQVVTVLESVNRAHEPVRSTEGSAVPYNATDPRLQLWVAATLYDTAVHVLQCAAGPLDDADLDAIYLDFAILGTSLQVPESAWPPDRAAFSEYWEAESAAFSVDDTVLRFVDDLFHPSTGPLWMRAGMPLVRIVTAGMLTPELRELYRIPWSSRRERRFKVAMTTIAVLHRTLPRRIRELPKDRLLKALG